MLIIIIILCQEKKNYYWSDCHTIPILLTGDVSFVIKIKKIIFSNKRFHLDFLGGSYGSII